MFHFFLYLCKMRISPKNTLSIVIPFYNGNAFLSDLLTSLRESYELSSKQLTPEIRIVNDSPQIAEQELLHICHRADPEQKLNIKLFTNPGNKGVAYSRDLGTTQASGDFITWIDQDDFVHPTYFSILEQLLQSQENIYLLNGYICKDKTEKILPLFYIRPTVNFKHILFSNSVLSTSFWIVNRSFLQTLNCHFSYPKMIYKGVDDWYFSLQLTKQKYTVRYIANRLIYYRFHANNFGHNLAESIDAGLELLHFLQTDETYPQTLIKSRIATLKFSKRFYLGSKLRSICSNPCDFIRFLTHYIYDKNRLFRLFIKLFGNLKFRT